MFTSHRGLSFSSPVVAAFSLFWLDLSIQPENLLSHQLTTDHLMVPVVLAPLARFGSLPVSSASLQCFRVHCPPCTSFLPTIVDPLRSRHFFASRRHPAPHITRSTSWTGAHRHPTMLSNAQADPDARHPNVQSALAPSPYISSRSTASLREMRISMKNRFAFLGLIFMCMTSISDQVGQRDVIYGRSNKTIAATKRC